MKVQFTISPTDFGQAAIPNHCPYPGCNGTAFWLHQTIEKQCPNDPQPVVMAYRFGCYGCRRTFRVYPPGVKSSKTPDTVKRLSILLYSLGLSYGKASLIHKTLGIAQSKTQIYQTVSAFKEGHPDYTRKVVFKDARTSDAQVQVKYRNFWVPLLLELEESSQFRLSFTSIPAADARMLRDSFTSVSYTVNVEFSFVEELNDSEEEDELVAADAASVERARRKTENVIPNLLREVDSQRDTSLKAIGVAFGQATADLERLRDILRSRNLEYSEELRAIYVRYLHALPPAKGDSASLAYRLRLLFLHCWSCLSEKKEFLSRK